MKFTVEPPGPPEVGQAAESEPPAIADIGMARRARLAEEAAAVAQRDVQALREQLDELRSRNDGKGDLDVVGPEHGGYKCIAVVAGGGQHPQIYVNAKDRTITCRQCGAVLDAFDVLMQYATAERKFSFHLTSLRQEAFKLREEIRELGKKRSSLRSQIRKKSPPPSSPAPADPAEREAWLKEMADKLGTEKSGK